MSLIKVTAEELHSLSSNVATGSNSIQDQLARMQGEVLGVVGGEWQGAASGQFHALWDEWQRSAAGLPVAGGRAVRRTLAPRVGAWLIDFGTRLGGASIRTS